MNLLSSFVLFAFVLLLSCNAQPKDNTPDTPPADTTVVNNPPADTMPSVTITGVKWMVSEVNGKVISAYPAQNKAPYLMLTTDGKAEGTGGCNGMGGSYTMADGNKISFQQMISTKMACPDMTLENDFSNALLNTNRYMVENGMLVLANDTQAALVKFTPAAE